MRALLLLGTSLAGLALYQAGRTRGAHGGSPAARAPIVTAPAETAPMDVTEVTRNFLMGFVLPLWLAAGIADWICHRATDIEHTTGTKESLMHLAMLVEAAVPVLAGMFLEVTSPVLALMIAAFLLHEATALWDVSYAVTRREVTPIEQHVHSFLEMVPLMAVSFLSVLHWPQLRALVGFGGRPDWSIRRKGRKLPTGYVVTMLSLMAALEWGPYLEELWRDLRASKV